MNSILKNLILLLLSINIFSCINKQYECKSDEECINNFIKHEIKNTNYDYIILSFDSDCEASFYDKMDIVNKRLCINKNTLIIHFSNPKNVKYKFRSNCSIRLLNFETAEKYDIYFNMTKVLKRISDNTYTLQNI